MMHRCTSSGLEDELSDTSCIWQSGCCLSEGYSRLDLVTTARLHRSIARQATLMFLALSKVS